MTQRKCPTCGSKGFDTSVLGPDRCTFCDGTEGGNPPTEEEIRATRSPEENFFFGDGSESELDPPSENFYP